VSYFQACRAFDWHLTDVLTHETSCSVGRTSTFIVAATVLVGSIPGVAADCWNGSLRYGYCDGLSYTVRIIIGLSIAFVLIAVLSLLGYRRRRATRANLVYLQRVPQSGGVPPSAPPQYPAQTYDSSSPTAAFVQVRTIQTTAVVQRAASPPPKGYA